MKSYGNRQATDMLRQAIDIGAQGERWQHNHMLWAQIHGLQGHKRLNRYESCCDREHTIKLQNYCVDMFGEVIEPDLGDPILWPEDIKGYLEAYLDWENSVYSRLGEISGSLISMGFPHEAELVKKGLPTEEIGKVRRMLSEYGLSGWDMAFILTEDQELHKKIKKMEKDK